MALIDAINALLGTKEKWNSFCSNYEGQIDLTLADLKNLDLKGRELKNCNFSGSDLENVNFDDCNIYNSNFSNCYIANASFVKTKILSCNFTKSKIYNSVFRGSLFIKSNLFEVNLEDTSFQSVNFNLSKLSNSKLSKIDFNFVRANNCELNLLKCINFYISNSDFDKSIINHSIFDKSFFENTQIESSIYNFVELLNSEMKNFSIVKSKVKYLRLKECNVRKLDFSDSYIDNVDLIKLDLPNSSFFNTIFVNCVWPKQKGFTNLLGTYYPNENLLGHPVNDIKGIKPTLRREIADAQFLREKLSSPNFFSRILYRIWGLTTNYGQSILRLTLFSFFLILISGILFNIEYGLLCIHKISFSSYIESIRIIIDSFFSLKVHDIETQYGEFQHLILTFNRIFGFIVIGLWIGLSANKIAKLSSV